MIRERADCCALACVREPPVGKARWVLGRRSRQVYEHVWIFQIAGGEAGARVTLGQMRVVGPWSAQLAVGAGRKVRAGFLRKLLSTLAVGECPPMRPLRWPLTTLRSWQRDAASIRGFTSDFRPSIGCWSTTSSITIGSPCTTASCEGQLRRSAPRCGAALTQQTHPRCRMPGT